MPSAESWVEALNMLINCLNKCGYDCFHNILRPLSFIFTGISVNFYSILSSLFPIFLKLKTSKQIFHVVTACKYGSGFLSGSDMRCLTFFLSLIFCSLTVLHSKSAGDMGGDSGSCLILLSDKSSYREKPKQSWEVGKKEDA